MTCRRHRPSSTGWRRSGAMSELIDVPVLWPRALLARAHGDDTGYREVRDRYRAIANGLGCEGYIVTAGAMT